MQESTKQAMSEEKEKFNALMEKNTPVRVIAAFLIAVGETMMQYELSLPRALGNGNKMNIVARMAENGVDLLVAEYYVFGKGSLKRMAKSLFKKQARNKNSKLYTKHLLKFKHIFADECKDKDKRLAKMEKKAAKAQAKANKIVQTNASGIA